MNGLMMKNEFFEHISVGIQINKNGGYSLGEY